MAHNSSFPVPSDKYVFLALFFLISSLSVFIIAYKQRPQVQTSNQSFVSQNDQFTGNKIPYSPPDITSDEEECLGTYLGVPYGEDENGDPLRTPTHVPATTCRQTYSETHLSLKYPCNWKVIPMVKKEVSKTCGYIREFYLLAGDTQSGGLTVNPPGTTTLSKALQKYNFNTSDCLSEAIGPYTGYRCESIFISELKGVVIELRYRRSEDMPTINNIVSSLQLKY